MPCLQAIPRVSSFLLCCLGTAATPGFRCTKAVSQCPVLQLRGSRCWCPRDPSVFVVLYLCVLSAATFWLSWKGGRSPGCLCLRFVSVLHTAAVEIHLSSTVHCAHPVSIPGAVPWLQHHPPKAVLWLQHHPPGAVPQLWGVLGCSALLLLQWLQVKWQQHPSARADCRSPGCPRLEQAATLLTSHPTVMIQWQCEKPSVHLQP